MELFNRKNKIEPQKLNAHWSIKLLYKLWQVIFTAFKVALGAGITVGLICFICVFVFANIAGEYLERDIMPNANISLGDYTVELNSTLYCIQDGQIKEYQPVYSDVNREWIDYEDIPENLINAAIAIEDHRFYQHQGVDWITTFKAIVRMFFGNDDAGGSSITQQLVKNITKESGVTVQRKVLEIFKATQLEKNYDKSIILEEYLNHIYMGQMCYGVRTAAAAYFGKEVQKLTLAECASLISITNSPTFYDPYQNFENNKERKENVLWAMLEHGFITQEEYDEAMNQTIVLKNGIDFADTMAYCPNTGCGYEDIVSTLNTDGTTYYCPKCSSTVPVEIDDQEIMYSYYTDTVLEDVAKALAEKDGMEWNDATRSTYMQQIQRGGYSIYTCIDLDVQAQVDKIYKDLSQIPDTRSGQQLQSAIVVKNKLGDIVAIAGGVGPDKEFDGLNRATDSTLQSGSSIKPLSVYAPAYEAGVITPATVVKDLPLSYNIHAQGAYPQNDNFQYSYSRTIHSGVTASVNAIAANTLSLVSPDYGFDFAKNKFHLSSLMEEYVSPSGLVMSDVGYGPLAMGAQTFGVRVRDMADAFHTFNNNGVYVKGRTFYKVLDSEGNVVLENSQNPEQILSQKTVDYMCYNLVNATQNGTGTEANLSGSYGITTAGKTGSTADFKDRWYCGFTGYYTAAVWIGYDTPERIYLTSGGNNGAAQLFKKVMGPLHEGLSDVKLYDASKMQYVSVCLDSGKLATAECATDVRGDRTAQAMVYPEDVPTEICDKHVKVEYCESGGGVATEYCKHFKEAQQDVTISEKTLCKLTKAEMEEILKAASYNLDAMFYRDDYVYLVDEDGKDGEYKGFYNNANQDQQAPYIVCTEHTKEAWENFQKEQEAQKPETPETPEETTQPPEDSSNTESEDRYEFTRP